MRNPLTTLCYIEKDDCYLMLHRVKKENDINKDKWIGVGGHAEKDESPDDCLLREVKEETGLDITFVTGFRVKDEHNLAREGRPNTIKQTVYFLAEYKNQRFVPQKSEISKIVLLDFESAMATLQFDSFKHILVQAHNFLTQNESIQ